LDFELYFESVSRKSKRITTMVGGFNDEKLDPHYLGYFQCFNKQLFYEAHEVLEHLWFKDRYGPNGAFYKGLIQLAGAFVHLQRNHLHPAAALFKLACANLEKYPRFHEHLNLDATRKLARKWLEDLERTRFGVNPLTSQTAPELKLERTGHE
jgi:predicted metal-dependent hydrolase